MRITIIGITPAEIAALHKQKRAKKGTSFASPVDVFMARVYAELPPEAPEIEPGLTYRYHERESTTYEVLAVADLDGDIMVKLKRVYGNAKGPAGSTLVEEYDKIVNDFLCGACVEVDLEDDS